MWFLIIIAVIVIIVLISRESEKTNNKEVDLKVKAAVLSAAPNFKYRCDYADTANHIRISYLVSNDCKSISFVSTRGDTAYPETRKILLSEIVDVQVDCDGEVQGGVGRAVVGGLLAGGVGAIVGASTAKKQITYFDIILTCRSVSDPVLLFRLIKSPVSTSSEQYKQALDFSRKVSASIKALMEMETESKKTDEEK